MLAHARARLPKSYRLLRSPDFASVLRADCQARDRYFAVFAVGNALPHPRMGLVVSRKVSASAVVRNSVKRHIRESVRRHQRQLKGLDLVVIAQPGSASASAISLRASLRRHWISIIEKCRHSS